ncbi:Bug family tripartite tricarboxylate transporter substrate binding protein [Comamonas composti]|uniref:Bug family tripartite tricarboxylate transporter substrate binding protein n=1 Tax=Comamonas composti TaxID=408558 RepID=UPI00041CDDA3|nr:tripartite tricarboxylate transporter substrate binding protein [Comamonas composti]
MNKRELLAAALIVASGLSQAQDAARSFPSKPVRIIVDFPPGGTVDVLTRSVGQKLSEKWKQPVVIENRPGAGGNIGAQAVAVSSADGYTLLATPPGPLTINQYLYKEMAFDPAKFESVVLMAAVPNAITTRAEFPASSVQDLVAYIKANPGRVTYGSQGNGSTSHLTGQMFETMIKGQMTHIPFKGEGPALTELLGGRVDLFFGNVSAVLKYRDGAKLKVLGLASDQRGFMAPDVPSAKESGVPEFMASAWFAIAAPHGTPSGIVAKLNQAINEVMQNAEVKKQFATQGAEVVGGSPADMERFMNTERVRWKKVIESANVKLD